MGRGYYAALKKQLLAHGYIFLRQGKDSHKICCDAHDNRHWVSVPVTINSRITANAILKQAGIRHKL